MTALLLALAVAQPAPLDDRAALEAKARALTQQAVQRHSEGKLAQAVPLAEEALALYRKLYPRERYSDGHADLATSLNNLGVLLKASGKPAQAEQHYRDALAMQRTLYPPARYPDGHPDLAATLNNLGQLLRDRGAPAQAEPLLREALAMRRTLYPDGHPHLAHSMNSLGMLLRDRGELVEAEPLLRDALAMRRTLLPKARFPDGHADVATSLNNLGLLHWARGELAQAEPLYRDALAMHRTLYPAARYPDGHPHLATSLNNLGYLLRARGELAQAEPLLRDALAIYRKLYPLARYPDGHADLAGSLGSLGALLRHRGELAQAEPLLRDALAMCRALYPAARFPAGHPQLAHCLNNLGALLQDRGELVQAERLYRDTLAMRRRLYPPARYPAGHPDLAGSLNNLGALLEARGQLAQAEPLYRDALTMCQRLYPVERNPAGHLDLARSLNNLGGLLRARGEAAQAESLFRASLEVQQRQMEVLLLGSSEAQALNYLAARPLTRDAYLSVARGDAPAYAAIWPDRGALARWLAQRRLLAADNPQAAALRTVRRDLTALLLSAEAADRARRLVALTERKEKLERELAQHLPAFGLALQAARKGPDDLRQLLPAGAAFVDVLRYSRIDMDPKKPGREGVTFTPSYLAFVLTRQEVRRVELGEAAEIDDAVDAWRRSLTGATSHDPDRPARALRKAVWEPLARHLPDGTQTVWLAPDGRLTGLPWAALPGSKPGTVLLEELTLVVVPHGGELLDALASRERKRPDGRLVALGGLDYGKAAEGKLAWPPLPATAKERDRVLALAADARVPGGAAADLLKELPGARWAHLATHGFFADPKLRSALRLDENDYARGLHGERVGLEARSPLTLSGLVLAGGNVVTADDLAGLSLDGLDLAVLSACDTGLGDVADGEGVLGLQRAFHIAGARNVIASLWKVDDEVTAALMSLFYHNLWQEKLAPAEALRQAQLTLYRHPGRIPALARDRGPDFAKTTRLPAPAAGGDRAHPRLWAGFVLSGPGR